MKNWIKLLQALNLICLHYRDFRLGTPEGDVHARRRVAAMRVLPWLAHSSNGGNTGHADGNLWCELPLSPDQVTQD